MSQGSHQSKPHKQKLTRKNSKKEQVSTSSNEQKRVRKKKNVVKKEEGPLVKILPLIKHEETYKPPKSTIQSLIIGRINNWPKQILRKFSEENRRQRVALRRFKKSKSKGLPYKEKLIKPKGRRSKHKEQDKKDKKIRKKSKKQKFKPSQSNQKQQKNEKDFNIHQLDNEDVIEKGKLLSQKEPKERSFDESISDDDKPVVKPPQISSRRNKQTLSRVNRQYARSLLREKNSFHLRKRQLLRKGLPIGQGSRKAFEKFKEDALRFKNQQTYRNKFLRGQARQGKDPLQLLELQAPKDNKSSQQQSEKKNQKDNQPPLDPEVKIEEPQVEVYVIRAPKRNLKGKISKYTCTTEESIKILNAYSIDGGDYKRMSEQLGFSVLKLRKHMKMHFRRALDIITKKVSQMGRCISDWESVQRHEIIRQFNRMRHSNRLLSEQNVEFRQKFQKIMMSYNDPSIELKQQDFNFLYRTIEVFIRGYCSNGTQRKHIQVKVEDIGTIKQNRAFLVEGGYISDNKKAKISLKSQFTQANIKRTYQSYPVKQMKGQMQIYEQEEENCSRNSEKMIKQWTPQQQRALGRFYSQHRDHTDAIIDDLNAEFGEKNIWYDVELVRDKINSLIKLGLYKLQDLASRPYNRQQFLRQQFEQKNKSHKIVQINDIVPQINNVQQFTQLIYNNKRVNKGQQGGCEGIFKDIPDVERKILGHIQSFQARKALISLLAQRFPRQKDIEEAVKATKQFIEYANDWEKKNNVYFIKKKKGSNPIKPKNIQTEKIIAEQSELIRQLQLDLDIPELLQYCHSKQDIISMSIVPVSEQ